MKKDNSAPQAAPQPPKGGVAKWQVGIIGAAGYTAGELMRVLVNHPNVELAWAHSESQAGLPVAKVHSGLVGDTDLCFTDTVDLDGIDVLFLCSAHGKSREFWAEHERPEHLRVIGLAQDYRDESDGYVYGLPEVNRDRIAGAQLVANPGCFATALQLALLPLASAGVLDADINVTAITGSTGAGVKPSATTHFSWRDNNISVYKAFTHQHLAEINRTLQHLQPGYRGNLNFLPMRGDFPRGIYAAAYINTPITGLEAKKLYEDFYRDAPFTHVIDKTVDMKQAVNTNKALLNVEKYGDLLLVTCAIDNLLKGASGQAVQNMNLMLGLPEDTALRLKASGF
ncbi:MAG: N-acetyl-gamma-glutamyl-phosphate reductase [Bacteroidales bacterium]|nr:N-acetyl-gamma-glutamyl-phosphate reductase [Bacteroidales bacterium]